MDRLAHFDIAVQHIAGSNFIDFRSRNSIGGDAIEDDYDEEYVIHILTEHAALNAKYGSLFDSQSNLGTEETENERKHNEKFLEGRIQSKI